MGKRARQVSYLLSLLKPGAVTVYEPGPTRDPLILYLRQIARYKLLSPEQEQALTRALLETGDIEVAKQLVSGQSSPGGQDCF